METKINVEQDGKFVSLSDKLASKTTSDSNSDSQWLLPLRLAQLTMKKIKFQW